MIFEIKIAHPSREASKQEITNSAVGRYKVHLSEEQLTYSIL